MARDAAPFSNIPSSLHSGIVKDSTALIRTLQADGQCVQHHRRTARNSHATIRPTIASAAQWPSFSDTVNGKSGHCLFEATFRLQLQCWSSCLRRFDVAPTRRIAQRLNAARLPRNDGTIVAPTCVSDVALFHSGAAILLSMPPHPTPQRRYSVLYTLINRPLHTGP